MAAAAVEDEEAANVCSRFSRPRSLNHARTLNSVDDNDGGGSGAGHTPRALVIITVVQHDGGGGGDFRGTNGNEHVRAHARALDARVARVCVTCWRCCTSGGRKRAYACARERRIRRRATAAAAAANVRAPTQLMIL